MHWTGSYQIRSCDAGCLFKWSANGTTLQYWKRDRDLAAPLCSLSMGVVILG
jgi:hypothetical protein